MLNKQLDLRQEMHGRSSLGNLGRKVDNAKGILQNSSRN